MKHVARLAFFAVAVTGSSVSIAQTKPTLWEPPPGDVAEFCRGAFDRLRDQRAYALRIEDAEAAERVTAEMKATYQDCASRTDDLAAWKKFNADNAKAWAVRDAAEKAKKEAERASMPTGVEELRAKEKEDQAATLARGKVHAEDAAFFVPTLSASICVARAAQMAAKAAIHAERSLAVRSGGGIIDMAQIHEMQEFVRTAETSERDSRGYLRARKKAPAACSSPSVLQLVGCVASPWRDEYVPFEFDRTSGDCDSPKLQPFLELDAYFTTPVPDDAE
jgi:hypothetical protein